MNTSTVIASRLKSFDACQISTPLWLRAVLGRGFAPTREEHHQLAAALNHGDEPMDAFIEAAARSGQAALWWRTFNALCDAGVEPDRQALTHMPALQALLDCAAHCPFEVDWNLAREGAEFIHSTGTLATDVLRDMALMGGYLMSAFNQTLVMTGDLEKGADARLSNTSRWWMTVTDPDANKAWCSGFWSTVRVRWVHAMVRRHLGNHPDWNASIYGLPINQPDMAATNLGFSQVMLLGLRKSGVFVSTAQSRAVMHLWKIIGWQIGVSSQWLVDSEKEAIVLLSHFAMTHTPPDETTLKLARALSDEPLSRNYGSFVAIRRRAAWMAHLSSSSWLLGASILNKLGLKSPVGPWLKLLELMPKTASFYAYRMLPAGKQRSIKRGRLEQVLAVNELHFDAGKVKQKAHPVHQAPA